MRFGPRSRSTRRPRHIRTRISTAFCNVLGASACRLLTFCRCHGSFAAQNTFRSLYPDFYRDSSGTRQFLLDVEERIHHLVRATIAHASPPKLQVVPLGADGVVVTYTSERGLCDLVDGLIRGTARHYGELFTVDQVPVHAPWRFGVCVHGRTRSAARVVAWTHPQDGCVTLPRTMAELSLTRTPGDRRLYALEGVGTSAPAGLRLAHGDGGGRWHELAARPPPVVAARSRGHRRDGRRGG